MITGEKVIIREGGGGKRVVGRVRTKYQPGVVRFSALKRGKIKNPVPDSAG
jgi:hypothetical protein